MASSVHVNEDALASHSKTSESARKLTRKAPTRSRNRLPAPERVEKRMSSPEKSNKQRKTTKTSQQIDDGQIGQDLINHVPAIADNFNILSKAGEGTFSTVYLATVKDSPSLKFALKHIVPTSAPSRIENELKCLQEFGGRSNIIEVKTTIREKDHVVFVLPYFKHDKFQDVVRKMSVREIREYIKNLFESLKIVHEYNIIHRDIKPSNFLYCRSKRRYSLVDFGLAMQSPGTTGLLSPASSLKDKRNSSSTIRLKNGTSTQSSSSLRNINNDRNLSGNSHASTSNINSQVLCPTRHTRAEICHFCTTRSAQTAPRAGTPGFRSPEVLSKYPHQTTAVDIWAAGVIFLSLLSERHPFFKAPDDLTALAQIIALFGSKKVAESGAAIGKEITSTPNVPGHDLRQICKRLSHRCCLIHDGENEKQSKKQLINDVELCAAKITNTEVSSATASNEIFSGELAHLNSDEVATTHTAPLNITDMRQRTKRKRLSSSSSNTRCSCIPDEAYDLLLRCLDLNPHTRISAADALEHPFLNVNTSKS